MFLLILEREEGGESEREGESVKDRETHTHTPVWERTIGWLPPVHAQTGIKPAN